MQEMGTFYENLSIIVKTASFAWWVYMIFFLTLFFGILFLNYIVKKFNETRLENRFTSLRNTTSANQATQVKSPVEMDNGHAKNISENLAQRISLVCNKEDNLLKDRRRKSAVTLSSSHNVAEDNYSNHSTKNDDINRSPFLGIIYRELYETRAVIDKTKSLLNADRDSEIIDKMSLNLNESKSTPSIKKIIQNEDLKEWAVGLLRSKIEKMELTATSGSSDLINK